MKFLTAMKLLLDQGLPLSAAALLCDAGFDTIHVGEIGMSEAETQTLYKELEKRGVLLLPLMQIFIHRLPLKWQLCLPLFALGLKGCEPRHLQICC